MADETKTESTETVVTPAPTGSDLWQQKVGAFAAAIGKPLAEVTASLVELTGEASDEGVALLENESDTPTSDIKEYFTTVAPAKLNKAIRGLRKEAPSTAAAGPAIGAVSAPAVPPSVKNVLPEPPDDESFLTALKVGGVSKVGATEINSALRAYQANTLKLFDLPELILKAMEEHALALNEPCDAEYYEMERLVKERRYADVLSALKANSNLVTVARQKELLRRLEKVGPTLTAFQGIIKAWVEQWKDMFNGPAAFAALIPGLAGAMGGMPPVASPPDMSSIDSAVESVIETFNGIFAGHGILVSRALAYDAMQIKKTLENPRLPALVGAANREEMLRSKLGVSVTADYVRMERNLVQYVLGIYEFEKQPETTRPAYIFVLAQLGGQIRWDLVGVAPQVGKRINGAGGASDPFAPAPPPKHRSY